MKEIMKGSLAFSINQRILKLKRIMAISFIEMGKLLKRVKDEELFKDLDYPTFRDYIASEIGIHWRTADYYIDIWKTFIERLGYEAEELSEYSYDKLRKLLPIVKTEKEPRELIEKALTLRWVDFERTFKADKRNVGYDDYLAPPEFLRCETCKKWIIICPKEDICKCKRL